MPQATYDEVLAMGDGDIGRGMEVFIRESQRSHAMLCECVPRIQYESDLASARKLGEHYQSLFERADKEANWNQARMFESWTNIAAQTRGMQRMARKIKALKVRVKMLSDMNAALLTANHHLAGKEPP